MKGKTVWSIFWALIFLFAAEIGTIISGTANSITIFGGMAIILGLSIALLMMTLKRGAQGKLKAFLLVMAIAPPAMLISILLHNLVYAVGALAFGEGVWGSGDEPFFFILGLIVCPVAFLVGAIGSIVLTIKTRANTPATTP